MNIKEFEKLKEEYLLTLPYNDDDEWYCSTRSIHGIGLDGFLKWLKAREMKAKRLEKKLQKSMEGPLKIVRPGKVFKVGG